MNLLVVGVVILVAGVGVFFVSNPSQQDSIKVGTGSIQVSTSFFHVNVTSNQISRVYVVNLSNWNISITSRTDGSAFGSFRSGFFTLSNGAKAEVLTIEDTNLVVVLDNGIYLILGPSDFQSFLNSFSLSVMRVSGGPTAQPPRLRQSRKWQSCQHHALIEFLQSHGRCETSGVYSRWTQSYSSRESGK